MLLLLYSSHLPIGPQPYPVRYVVANPVRSHTEVPRSTVHIIMTTRYSDQQGSKSRQKVMRLCKQSHRPISKGSIKPPYSISRVASIDSDFRCLPTTSVLSNKSDKYVPNRFDQQYSKFLKATHRTKIRKIKIPRSMVVEALSW